MENFPELFVLVFAAVVLSAICIDRLRGGYNFGRL